MMRKYILAILLFMICPCYIKAAGCSNADKVKYQELAKNISYTYEYKEENGNVSFNIIFSNINENLYLYDQKEYKDYPRTDKEMIIPALEGKSYRFGVYTSDSVSGCDGFILYTIYVNTPYYNEYYQDSLCEGIEDYKFCNKWLNMDIDYDTFKENVLKYKNSLYKEEEVKKKEEKENLLYKVLDFYIDYYYIILPLIIIACLIGVKLYDKKHDLF